MTGPIRVLHVDDEPDLADVTAEFLVRENDRFDVTTETDPRAAVERFERERFDAVVTDYQMDGMDGIELLETIRERRPELPVILYTGKGSEDIASDAISAGVTDYLRKRRGSSDYTLLANRLENAVDRYRTQREAERTRRQFEALYENDLFFVATLDPDGSVRRLNRTTETVTGVPTERARGEPFREMPWWADERQCNVVEEHTRRAGDGEPVQFRTRFVVDGTTRTALGAMVPVAPDDGVDSILAVGQDVTESARYLWSALDVLEEVLFIFDSEFELREWNSTAADVTGYRSEELRHRPLLEFITEDDTDQVMAAVDTLLDTGSATVEARLLTASGQRIPYKFRASRLPTDGGQPGFVGIGYDVTERKRRERELKRQNERLDRFVDTVAHDLQGPLSVAQSRLELARSDGQDVDRHLDAVADAHGRIGTLIQNLLALARNGDTVDRDETVDVAAVATAAWNHVETGAATLAVGTDLTVEADRSRLQQLFENLFGNAIEHGGEEVTVTVDDLPDGRGFYVADDGPGIPADDRDRLFEFGYSTAPEGTGIGLFVVAEIARAHGWEVVATDRDGGGARIEISGRVPEDTPGTAG